MQQKKSILQTCGHRLGQKDFSSPKSEQRRVKDMTSDRALASRAHSEVPTFLFLFYFSGFVSFRSVFSQFTHLFFCKATDSLQFLFWSSETNQQNKGMKPCGETKKKNKKKDLKKKGQMLPFLSKSATLHRMKILLCYFQNSGIEQCCLVMFNLLYSVLMLFMDYLKPVCFMLIIYIFFLYIKKTEKKTKKDIIAHYLAHTRKSGSCLRKARVPEYQLHAILMYIFMSLKKKTKQKKNKG